MKLQTIGMMILILAAISSSLLSTVSSSSPLASMTSTSLQGSKHVFNKRHDLGNRGQWLMRQVSVKGNECEELEPANLRRKMLKTLEVSCNDGSPAGYYIRRSPGSDKWIVFLEGGWYCFDHISCSERFRVMGEYMSSKNWPKYRSGNGILSWDPEENPYYFNTNVVYVPYCSSDSWSGTRNKTTVMNFSFMGSLILDNIFKELLKKGMRQSKTVIVAGTSAGGTGVLINLDRIAAMIHAVNHKIKVLGIVDAGWFLDNEPFKAKPCRNSFTCSPVAGIQKGTRVWESRLPDNCTAHYPTEIWKCFFGHRVYPSLRTPVYIIQNLYDTAQIQVNNVIDESMQGQLTSEQWRYLLNLGDEMKATLQNVSLPSLLDKHLVKYHLRAVFSPGCVSHEILTKSEWYKLRIEGLSLAESIHCWEDSHSIKLSCQQSKINPLITKNETPLSDESLRSQDKRRRWKNEKQKWKNEKKGGNRNKHNSNSRPGTRHCQHKLIDTCPWPHCNCSCPKYRWDALSQAHLFFLKTLATVMGIDPGKMATTRLCGS